MNVNPLGTVEIAILLIGGIMVFLTSAWSPLKEQKRFAIDYVGLIAAVITIPSGLAYAKHDQTFLAGVGKPGLFYSWAFGLWFALSLLRSGTRGPKIIGSMMLVVFGILLYAVISEAIRLVASH